jgi:hypothetical protein
MDLRAATTSLPASVTTSPWLPDTLAGAAVLTTGFTLTAGGLSHDRGRDLLWLGGLSIPVAGLLRMIDVLPGLPFGQAWYSGLAGAPDLASVDGVLVAVWDLGMLALGIAVLSTAWLVGLSLRGQAATPPREG